MENFTIKQNYFNINFSYSVFTIYAQTVTTPQVNLQRTSAATPTKKIYNVKNFTMLGNTNLTCNLRGQH
jgi:hypothetical protein